MILRFNRVAAQGELLLTRQDYQPVSREDWVAVPPEGPYLVVGHSETGHHHVIDREDAVLWDDPSEPLTRFLEVRRLTQLRHLRDHDTHPSIELQPGLYRVRTGREFDPFTSRWRESAD